MSIKNDFPWGKVLNEHRIGDYCVIEYQTKDGGVWYYAPHKEGAGSGSSHRSLEAAIVHCISNKDFMAAHYACKLLEFD